MIIDAHVHLYPPYVYENPDGWARQRGELGWLACVLPIRGPFLQGWASVEQLLLDMDAAGVDQAVLLGWYWENSDTCEENLAWQMEWVKARPDRLIGFAPFNARGGARALDMLRRAFDAGFRGIGELNPPAQGYEYDDPDFNAALQLAAEANALVTVHVTEPAGHPFPGKIDTPFPQLVSMAERHPQTRFVFAHLGGLLPFHELNRHTARALANVFYDTAAAPLLYHSSVYRRLCDMIGDRRLLFGTDYPLKTYPSKAQPKPSFENHLADLRAANLSDAELNAILGGNLHRLLRQPIDFAPPNRPPDLPSSQSSTKL